MEVCFQTPSTKMGRQTVAALCSTLIFLYYVAFSFSFRFQYYFQQRRPVASGVKHAKRNSRTDVCRPRCSVSLQSSDDVSDSTETVNAKTHAIFHQVKQSLRTIALNELGQPSSEKDSMMPLYVLENNRQRQPTPQELNFKIVQCGQRFASYSTKRIEDGEQASRTHALQSPMTRVPGCVATVHISTKLIQIDGNGTETTLPPDRYYVQLDGTADALLSRGLLALVAASVGCASQNKATSVLHQIFQVTPEEFPTAQDILQIDPATVADELGLRDTLSRGRNDGLSSIVKVMQQQIRWLLNMDEVKSVHMNAMADTPFGEVTGGTDRSRTGRENKNDDTVMTIKKKKVAMLLSGGVDSSVALNLLVRDPQYEVHAFYLKIWLEDELAHLGQCPWEDDWEVCQNVVAQAPVHVPLEAIPLQEQYRDQIIQYTIEEAKKGRTPNPDIMCNARVKFGCFYDAISDRDFDFIATGHYARAFREEGGDGGNTDIQNGGVPPKVTLHRAPDPVKDQSYFLSALSQEQLSRVLFPIGAYTKKEVRSLAQEFDLPNKDRPDSQGLCFLGKVKFDSFLAAYLGEEPGDIVDAHTGEIIGRHKGLWFHTVGQRKGIGKVLDPKVTARGPWYIVAKDPSKNLLLASNEYDGAGFIEARSDFVVEDIRWVSGELPKSLVDLGNNKLEGRFDMKIRHGPTIVAGSMTVATGCNEGRIKLDGKDGGLAPGQFVVFYELESEECLGSGVISERHWAQFLSSSKDFLKAAVER